MAQPILWIHGDCLSPHNPVFQAHPGAPALWVWDDVLLAEWQISLKRVAFIYECLLELPVTIRRGDTVRELLRFAQEQGAEQLVTAGSPSPRFDRVLDEVEKKIEVDVLAVDPFLDYDGHIDLKRFSRYWKVAQGRVYDRTSF
jgi:hypothetical protein